MNAKGDPASLYDTTHEKDQARHALAVDRTIGFVEGRRPGPTIVLTGAIHGNEPAGAIAIRNVLDRLHELRDPLRGSVLGLVGNRRGLSAARRYIDRDLNRRWLPADIADLSDPTAGRSTAEDDEQRELLRVIVPILATATEPVVFLDLHSTSAPGIPFCCMADVLRNRPVASILPIPLILGIEEILEGSMLGYLCDLGHIGVAVEGGQNEDPATVQNHEATIWLTLVACGALASSTVPEYDRHVSRLASAARGIPHVVEIRHRHVVHDDDEFTMGPGFSNFTPLREGQVVAHDRSGPIAAGENGIMLMPRYQAQGDDGFFLARSVRPFWLRVSAGLRFLRAERLVPLLPGVARHPSIPDRFLVNPKVARFQTVNIFHLLGFRHVRSAGDQLVFSRRRPGFRGISELPPELQPFA